MFIVLILSDKTLIVSLSLALSAITSVVFCGLLFDFELDCETSSFVSTSSFDSSCSLKLENHFLIKISIISIILHTSSGHSSIASCKIFFADSDRSSTKLFVFSFDCVGGDHEL